MFGRIVSVWALALLLCSTASADKPFPAHRVVGNVSYVGSDALAIYLITTPDGHVLINSGFDETVPLIQASVESLGFKMTDVKILVTKQRRPFDSEPYSAGWVALHFSKPDRKSANRHEIG